MSLYHKYRPIVFEEIFGNTDMLDVLQSCVEKDPPHAFLLHGPTGCGKTTVARIIAASLNSSGSDFREIDSADFRGIDMVREIRRQSQFVPLESGSRVWLIDECHKLTNDAQNALLKALEDAPGHVYYILATTDPQKLLATIKGRCAQFQVSPLVDQDMYRLLRHVVKEEGEQLKKYIYDQIVERSGGLPRGALQLLEQVLSVPEDQRMQVAQKYEESTAQGIQLCQALISGAGWKKISHILVGLKEEDPEGIRRQVLGYCTAILLKEKNTRAGEIMDEFIEPFYNSGFAGVVFACFSLSI